MFTKVPMGCPVLCKKLDCDVLHAEQVRNLLLDYHRRPAACQLLRMQLE
jgi:hypothetical protein